MILDKRRSGNIKSRTGVLGQALADAGFQSVHHACEAARAYTAEIGEILNGKLPLINKNGTVNASARRFAEVLGETPERLFGYDVFTPRIPKGRVLPSVDGDQRHLIRQILRTLTDRQRQILDLLFLQGRTISELAAEFNVTGMWIQQTRNKALRRLRYPNRRRILEECASFNTTTRI